MESPKQFVKKIAEENQALFKASAMQVKAYFEQELSQEELVDHFIIKEMDLESAQIGGCRGGNGLFRAPQPLTQIDDILEREDAL